jgi:hypothetical protein
VRAESAYNVFFIKKLKAMGVAIPLIWKLEISYFQLCFPRFPLC